MARTKKRGRRRAKRKRAKRKRAKRERTKREKRQVLLAAVCVEGNEKVWVGELCP